MASLYAAHRSQRPACDFERRPREKFIGRARAGKPDRQKKQREGRDYGVLLRPSTRRYLHPFLNAHQSVDSGTWDTGTVWPTDIAERYS